MRSFCQDNGSWRDGETSFFKMNVWRGQAEHLATPSLGVTGHGHRPTPPAQLGDPRGGHASVTEVEADEVGASLKWATAKVERTSQPGNGECTQGREWQADRVGDFTDQPPF
jgi:single-strand DNA-binding protein